MKQEERTNEEINIDGPVTKSIIVGGVTADGETIGTSVWFQDGSHTLIAHRTPRTPEFAAKPISNQCGLN